MLIIFLFVFSVDLIGALVSGGKFNINSLIVIFYDLLLSMFRMIHTFIIKILNNINIIKFIKMIVKCEKNLVT